MLERMVHKCLIEINAHHSAARGAKDLRGELSHETQPNHGDALAQPHIGLTNSVHRDASERRKRCAFERQVRRYPHAQVAGHAVDLGVHRAGAAARHVIAR